MSKEVEMPQPAHSLLGPPNSNQRQLLEVVAHGREIAEGHQWPFFQYVEQVLYEGGGLDATEVMLTCPRVTFGVAHYGWFRVATGSLSPRPDDRVYLTVAGLVQLPEWAPKVEIFLRALACLVEAERSIRPSPTEVVPTAIRSDELLAAFWRKHQMTLSVDTLEFILSQVDTEPSTWLCRLQRERPPSPHWVMTLSTGLRRYAGVTAVEEYLDHLLDQISPPAPARVANPSALALPEAIDYLNVVWELRSTGPLFGRAHNVESAAKLALGCDGSDEFDSRMCALCSIIGQAKFPGDKTDLADLQAYVTSKLASEAADRAGAAIEDLRALLHLRAARQNGGDAEAKGRRAMRRLGIVLPTAEWGSTWEIVRGRCIAALNALREEIEAAPEVDFKR
ncbi:MAG: hypothetical protein ABSB54_04945 [Acidimicrobiales bacterium]|jgi:hypothetical protein